MINRLEEALQKSVAQYLDTVLLADTVWFHPPNGGARSKAEAGKFKAMGVKAGAPDICLFRNARAYFIELKGGRGTASKNQKHMHERLGDAGCPVAICRSLAEVQGTLKGWQIPTRDKGALVEVRPAP